RRAVVESARGHGRAGRPIALLVGRPRRGSLLVEVAMATVMLMIAMSLTVKVLGHVGAQRRASEYRQRALQEIANVMERLTAHPYDAITAELTSHCKLSSAVSRSLPDAELSVGVAQEQPGGGRSVKRITVSLRWRGRSGEWEAPVRLSTWVE